MCRSHLGFNLIELILVIVIISLLVAVAIPAITGARRSANTATCLSNQRTLANEMLIYADDHDSVLPGAGDVWAMGLPPAMYTCPLLRDQPNGYVYNINVSSVSMESIRWPHGMVLTADGFPDSRVTVRNTEPYEPNTIVDEPSKSVFYVLDDVESERHNTEFIASYLDGHAALTKVKPAIDIP